MDLNKEYNQLLNEIGEKNIRIEYETGNFEVTGYTMDDLRINIIIRHLPSRVMSCGFFSNSQIQNILDSVVIKIIHLPTGFVSYGWFSDSQIENKVSALNHLKRKLQKMKRSKYTSYSFLVLTYLLAFLFSIYLSERSSMERVLLFWVAFFCYYIFITYFALVLPEKIPKIHYKYFIAAFIGGLMFSYIGKVYSDETQRPKLIDQIKQNKILKEGKKMAFENRVTRLKIFIKEDSLNLRTAYELGIKQPNKHKNNGHILSNKTIASVQIPVLPLKKALNANAYFQLGLIHDQNYLGQNQSISYYKKAVEIDSTIRDYHLKLASSACNLNEYNLAFKHLKIALDLDSTKTWVTSEYSKRHASNILEYYQDKLEIEKEAYMQFAGIKFDRRVSNLKVFIDQDSINVNDLLVLGIKYKKPLNSNILDSKNTLNANAYFQIGKMYEKNLELNTAISYYKKAVEIDTTNRDYHLRLASRASIVKKYALAKKHYQIVSGLYPTEIWILPEISTCNLLRIYPDYYQLFK